MPGAAEVWRKTRPLLIVKVPCGWRSHRRTLLIYVVKVLFFLMQKESARPAKDADKMCWRDHRLNWCRHGIVPHPRCHWG